MCEVAEVSKITVAPNDVLVVRVKGRLTKDMASEVRKQFEMVFDGCDLKPRVMIVDDGIDLSVISMGQVARLG